MNKMLGRKKTGQTATLHFKPFSEKHKRYVQDTETHIFNFAEGAVRSGKTVCNVIAFAFALEKSPDRIHLATGVTLATACLNIGDCNGFGLEYLFRGRCRWGKYKGNTCLYVKTDKGTRIVIFTGGGKADSYKKIRGGSFGMWIATEINKHYISHDDTCFIREAFNRQLAALDRKVFWDFNPDYPTHPIYTEYVDKYRFNPNMSVNYKHFTIKDNIAVSDRRRKEIEEQYEKDSIWYKRAILGERVAAQGLIFGKFALKPAEFTVKAIPEDIAFISIGCDYGGNLSKTAFVATGIRHEGRGVCVLAADKVEGEKGEVSPDILEKRFVLFVRGIEKRFSLPVLYGFMDSEAQYLTAGVSRACQNAGLTLRIGDCRKLPIIERIAFKSRLLSENRWSVLEDCRQVIDCTASQLWDVKNPDRRLDDGTTDIDTADAEEYSWERFIQVLTKGGQKDK